MSKRWRKFVVASVAILVISVAVQDAPAAGTAPTDTVFSYARGFDTACAPTESQMATWWQYSPYWNVGVYIGGDYIYCTGNPNLNPTWVSDIAAQGWMLLPIWGGPQAPAPCGTGGISTNTVTADSQGRSEAVRAHDAAVALGMTGATVIFYDIEGFGAGNNSTCDNAVYAFLNGWDVVLRETYGIHPGIYGSASGSGAQQWAYLANVPDDVYLADTGSPPNTAPMSVWNLTGVSNDSWKIQPPYGRHHQHTNNVYETYGGLTIQIDAVCSRGHVAGTIQRGTDGTTPCPGTVP